MKQLSTISVLGLILIFISLLSCSGKNDKSQPLAQVGDEVIGLEDFKRAYLPVLLYSDKKESPATREEILNFLIDQSILSQSARDLDLDTIPTLNVLRRTAEKTAFTRLLYKNQVRKKLQPISESELRQAYKRSHTKRLVSHLFAKDSAGAYKMYTELQQGAPWDSLASASFADPSLASSGGVLGWMTLGDMDPVFEKAAFQLPLHEYSEPIQTKFGWHIIQVLEESRELMLTEYDFQLERSSLEQTLRQRQENQLADSIINQIMVQADLQFKEKIATQVWVLIHDQIHQLLDGQDLHEVSPREMRNFEAILEPLLDEVMMTFSGTSWTVKDFVDHLPEMNRQLMLTDLKQATAFLIRDEVIYRSGREQGFHEREDVQAEVRDRENQFLANLYLRYKASGYQPSEKSVADYYSSNATNRYLAPDSLFIQEIRLLDPNQGTAFVDALTSGGSLESHAQNFSLKITNLGWVQGATPESMDYYHRLVGKPVNTLLGPFYDSVTPTFIRATVRHRHTKPLEHIYDSVQEDAFEHWLQRLKLEELKQLRSGYKITIDRELLLAFEI